MHTAQHSFSSPHTVHVEHCFVYNAYHFTSSVCYAGYFPLQSTISKLPALRSGGGNDCPCKTSTSIDRTNLCQWNDLNNLHALLCNTLQLVARVGRIHEVNICLLPLRPPRMNLFQTFRPALHSCLISDPRVAMATV